MSPILGQSGLNSLENETFTPENCRGVHIFGAPLQGNVSVGSLDALTFFGPKICDETLVELGGDVVDLGRDFGYFVATGDLGGARLWHSADFGKCLSKSNKWTCRPFHELQHSLARLRKWVGYTAALEQGWLKDDESCHLSRAIPKRLDRVFRKAFLALATVSASRIRRPPSIGRYC